MSNGVTQRTALDLTRYHFKRELAGNITVYGTWWLAEDSGPKQCLVLVPTLARTENVVPCVVPQSQAWMWSEAIGDPVETAKTSFMFADWLGLDVNNHSDVFRVRSVIHDHLQDLLNIPPMPEAMRDRTVIGEAQIRARESDRMIRHEEVTAT